MNIKYRIALLLLFSLSVFTTFGQRKIVKWDAKPFERKAFIENKGQFKYQISDNVEEVKYCIDKDYRVCFYSNHIEFELTKKSFHPKTPKYPHKEDRLNVKKQRIRAYWVGANPNAEIVAIDKLNEKFTYVIDGEDGLSINIESKGFSRLIYKGLYPDIDVEYIAVTEGVKYNVILHPGANPDDIKLRYDSPLNLSLDGDLSINTIRGAIIEKSPKTFYANNEEEIIESEFKLLNNEVNFTLSNYDNTKKVIIDPLMIIPTAANPAYDNGIDDLGNIYVYGGTANNFTVEKYDPAGALVWSLVPAVVDRTYYGDMLVDKTGEFYLSEGFKSGGAKTYKFDATSAAIWTSTFDVNFQEHWRLALNCVTNKVIVAGGGTTAPTLNIAEIDVNTGNLINAKTVYNGSQSDVSGLAVDQMGKAYLTHSNPNVTTFTDNANNMLANVNNGYGFSEIGSSSTSYYPNPGFGGIANGYNMMVLGGGFLFTTDGAEIKKWDITTQTIVNTATIPGAARLSSGILADDCDNLFVGGDAGIYRFDFNLNQLEFQPTTAPVFDIAFSVTSPAIVACGTGYLEEVIMGRVSCASVTKNITIDSCTTTDNSVEIIPTVGLSPFTYLWSDGNTDSLRANMSPGTYTITIKDASCVPSLVFDTVIIPPKLFVADFTNDTVCDNLITNFTAQVPQIPGVITYAWNFGNGNTSNIANPTNSYNSSGSYPVQLIASSSTGCADTILKSVIVNNAPIAGFSVSDVCLGLNSNFINSSSVLPPDTINAYAWDFGNGGVSGAKDTLYEYSTAGTYPVQLIITTDKGCSDTSLFNTMVYSKPVADFTITAPCEGDFSGFTDITTIGNGNVTGWNWTFNDPNAGASALQNPTYSFTQSGTYNTELIVTSNNNCKDTVQKPVTVFAKPVTDFIFTSVCFGDQSTLTDQSTITVGSITQYDWKLDNTSYLASNIIHNFSSQGFNDVTLVVTSNNNCKDSVTKQVNVYELPIPSFDFSPQEIGFFNTQVCFDNQSINNDINEWDFGFNGQQSVNGNPCIEFPLLVEADYIVWLKTTTINGCVDSISRQVSVKKEFVMHVPNTFTPDGDGKNDIFLPEYIAVSEITLYIFNRWGDLLFQTDKLNEGWDGTYNDEFVKEDSYVYKIIARKEDGRKYEKIGHVNVLR